MNNDLRALASTGMTNGSNANSIPTVSVIQGQPNGCGPECTLAPTQESVLLASSQRGRQCQIKWHLRAGTYMFGQGIIDPVTESLQVASKLIPPASDFGGVSYNLAVPNVVGFNYLTSNYLYAIKCVEVRVTTPLYEGQINETLYLNHSDPFNPFAPCEPTQVYTTTCNPCIGQENVTVFNDCVMFAGPTDSMIYTVREGFEVDFKITILSADVNTNQVPC